MMDVGSRDERILYTFDAPIAQLKPVFPSLLGLEWIKSNKSGRVKRQHELR